MADRCAAGAFCPAGTTLGAGVAARGVAAGGAAATTGLDGAAGAGGTGAAGSAAMVSLTEIVGSDEATGALVAGLAETLSTGAGAACWLLAAATLAAALAAVTSATMRATSA